MLMEPPNWKCCGGEQLALSNANKTESGGSFACPRCGGIANSAAAYKKHMCPAKTAKVPLELRKVSREMKSKLRDPRFVATRCLTFMGGASGAGPEHLRLALLVDL